MNYFDCPGTQVFNEGPSEGKRGVYSALAGTFILLSLVILTAHAIDAFRLDE